MSSGNDILCNDIVFEHIGVAVNSISESMQVLNEIFNLKEVPEIYEDALQNIKISFVNLSGVKIELIEPLDSNRKSPLSNLASMATMQRAFDCPVGYSDHTFGDQVALAAVTMGACWITWEDFKQ